MDNQINKVIEWIAKANHAIAFTGAGISVESGVPPFRGENGLWNKYDPSLFDISYFNKHPEKSWQLFIKIFYEFFEKAEPNMAHKVLADMEKHGYIQAIITQNIDNLHQEAGSKIVFEFHGNTKRLICRKCKSKYSIDKEILKTIPPVCEKCKTILKPDIVFFSEPIPEEVSNYSFAEAEESDLVIIIGTTGEIQPAAMIPYTAKKNGARIIEINVEKSNYTDNISDVFLQGRAGKIMVKIMKKLKQLRLSHNCSVRGS